MSAEIGTVFVTNTASRNIDFGVHKIPRNWLENWSFQGFREATKREEASWYDERNLDRPEELEIALKQEAEQLSQVRAELQSLQGEPQVNATIETSVLPPRAAVYEQPVAPRPESHSHFSR